MTDKPEIESGACCKLQCLHPEQPTADSTSSTPCLHELYAYQPA